MGGVHAVFLGADRAVEAVVVVQVDRVTDAATCVESMDTSNASAQIGAG